MNFLKNIFSFGSKQPNQNIENKTILIQKKFDVWNYNTAKELENMAITLPIVSENTAVLFYKKVAKLTNGKQSTAKRTKGSVFTTLQGFISACERQDLKVDCFSNQGHIANGIMSVEGFDPVMSVIFVVARISQSDFLFEAFVGKNAKTVVKGLFLN